MPYGYLGEQPKQSKANSGVFNSVDALNLLQDGEWGGSLEHIETLTPSGVNSVNTSVLPINYNVIKIVFTVVSSSAAGNVHRMRFFESGVEETGNVYHIAEQYMTAGGSYGISASSTATWLNLSNFGNANAGGYAYLFNLSDATKYSSYLYHSGDDNGSGYFGSGALLQKSTIDQIKFMNSSGAQTFQSGTTIKIYGVKEL
jgi:hypothetical protein